MIEIPSQPRTRKQISKGKRFHILGRDGFKCVYCGSAPPDVVLHIDHRVAVANGGGNDDDNLVTACLACNIGKGASVLQSSTVRDAAGRRTKPQVEIFWEYELTDQRRVVRAHCVQFFAEEKHPFGGYLYNRLCRDHALSTHGRSCRGFSPYEAAMYAVEILTKRWVRFQNYIEFIDDLNVAASLGLLPQHIAPHVLRALHWEIAADRCKDRPNNYPEIVDRIAEQSMAAFDPFLKSQHYPWKDAVG